MTASNLSHPTRRLAWLGLVGPVALAWLGGCSAADAGKGGPGQQQATGGMSNGTGGMGPVTPAECASGPHPGKAQVRRLTRFEYNNAVRDLFGETSSPANAFPPETISRTGNLFGNDASLLSVSNALASQWSKVAGEIAGRATATPEGLGKLAACASGATPDDACLREVITNVVSRAYHRDVTAPEVDSYLTLANTAKGTGPFASGVSAVIEAVLQGPEYLYRIELGTPDAAHPGLRIPTGDEMAARLSFLFWGTIPDAPLRMAAKSGELSTPAGVKAQAERLLNDPQAKPVVRFFFDNLLPISGLTNLARDKGRFPVYTQDFAAALREETQTFLEHEIFDGAGGTWKSALTAPYTYVNEQLATFYGIPGITGSAFQKANWPNPAQRLGLLSQASILTGTITTNESNPVLRGSFIINKLLCMNIQLPTDPTILAMVKVPEGVSGATARERFTKHREQAVCAGCHAVIDPVGFPLENYDPIGAWRDQENGVTIDASGNIPGGPPITNGVGLMQSIADSPDAQACFAQHWMNFGYGKTIGDDDACVKTSLIDKFNAAGGNIKQLLVELTQTDDFLYLPAKD
jgi:hypothetical protein